MSDVKELCKRVIIINEGKILYDGLLEKIVKKYAPYKVIKVDFDPSTSGKSDFPLLRIDKEKLELIGKVKEFDGSHAKIQIRNNLVAERAAKLLSEFKVADLTIEDPAIEDIVREVFSKA